MLNSKFNAVICQIERTRIESGLPDGFDDLVPLRFPQQLRTNRHMSGLYFTAAGSVSEALYTRALEFRPGRLDYRERRQSPNDRLPCRHVVAEECVHGIVCRHSARTR